MGSRKQVAGTLSNVAALTLDSSEASQDLSSVLVHVDLDPSASAWAFKVPGPEL